MNAPLFCENCNQEREYVILKSVLPYEVKHEKFVINGNRVLCIVCGEDIFHLDIEQENQQKAFDNYRHKYELLNPDEIKAIRDKYQLSARDFSLLLGFGPKTIARFERGSLQTVEQNQRIIAIKQHSHMLKLFKLHGNRISEEAKGRLETSSTLSDKEKETVIQFDEQTDMATVYTASWMVAKTLKKAGFQPTRRKDGAWWFQIPVHAISIPNAIKPTKEIVRETIEELYNSNV